MLPISTVVTKLLQTLRQGGGVASGADLRNALGVSQPTVSRALAPLIQSGQVQKVGAARSQRYVLPRQVSSVGNAVPIMRVGADGQPRPFARMVLLEVAAFGLMKKTG